MPCAQRPWLAAIEHDATMEEDDLVTHGAGEVQVLGREEHPAAARRQRRDGLAEHDDRLWV